MVKQKLNVTLSIKTITSVPFPHAKIATAIPDPVSRAEEKKKKKKRNISETAKIGGNARLLQRRIVLPTKFQKLAERQQKSNQDPLTEYDGRRSGGYGAELRILPVP